ncbi:cAAX amino protease [Clostridium sp. CAG:921]|nr:cAAX amino protease [Clostridium sp. CAG:921]
MKNRMVKFMNKKLVKEFLMITFIIMIVFWGGCTLISQMFNLTIDNIFLRIMHIIGGFSPTIASYISLKRNNEVKNFKEWLKRIFDIKHNIFTYVLIILFVAIYYILGCAINGFEFGTPIFMLIVILPMMLVGGGNEEVGWRMILQPELEKKYGFNLATIFTATIWWLWHLPIFFIKGTANSNMNYFLFGIMCLMLSYVLATIRKISNGVFPCILTHCLINGLSAIFLFNYSLLSCCVSLIVTIIVSMSILNINKRCVS